LRRLSNIRKLQLAKEDEKTWNALSWQEKQDKEKWLMGEEKVAKGFMGMATRTLGLIDLLTRSEEVACCFTQLPFAQRAATAFLGFLDSLCGTKSMEVKVKDMDRYSFKPKQLLKEIIEILLRIVKQDTSKSMGFLHSMASDPDYNETTMEKVLSIIQSKGFVEETIVTEFTQVLQELVILREALQNEDGGGAHVSSQSDKPVAEWQTAVDEIELDMDELEDQYKTALGDMLFDTTELQEYHSFQSNAAQSFDPRSQRAKALMKEMKQWSEHLPIHPNAAIFVRQDEERMDMVRAMITGPDDTPYSRGCFVFDIYFPPSYPNIPPLVKLITTGNGTVRFNPNLYADGKVCLSLLGTWHGGDSSQKWQPSTSSLYQVLVSIQGMILISDPMYNEPGYENIKDTAEGKASSDQYNSRIRLWTIRYAMLGQLKNPPKGLEDLIRAHFHTQQTAILKQCSVWLQECEDKEEERKLRRVIDELKEEFKIQFGGT